MATTKTAPRFFATPAEFRAWLAKNHAKASELLVGYYKKDSGRQSITWPESVEEALRVGWIDGIRRSRDAESYTIRFTPRRPGSIWSPINVRTANALMESGRMHPAGKAAFEGRIEDRIGVYSYRQRHVELPAEYAAILKKNAKAARHFASETPSYRKHMMWRIVSAKREETRRKRLHELIKWCAQGKRLPQYDKYRPKKSAS